MASGPHDTGVAVRVPTYDSRVAVSALANVHQNATLNPEVGLNSTMTISIPMLTSIPSATSDAGALANARATFEMRQRIHDAAPSVETQRALAIASDAVDRIERRMRRAKSLAR